MTTSPARRLIPHIAVGVCALLLTMRGTSAQTPAPATPTDAALTIAGDVTRPLTLSPAELKTMPRTTVTIVDQGREVKYTGVLVGEVLAKAGAPLGRDLSGAAVATYVLASAKDGYQVVFSLAELDPAFTPNDIIIADSVDGQPLFDYQGAFRLVAPHDKRGARSVRMLQRLEVVRLKK
jgi:DMSO/TMAO reductase YedYZ molybdopterin-dependent catalytic subunit